MKSVTAIVTAHGSWDRLVKTLGMLERQVWPPNEVIVAYSDITITKGRREWLSQHCDVTLKCEDMNDSGNDKRARALPIATGDLVGFFNDDDKYSSKYIYKLVNASGDADIIACDFMSVNTGPLPVIVVPRVGHITSGCFLFRRDAGQRVGYNHRDYTADGQFVEDIIADGGSFARVPEVLYVHY